MTNLEKIKKLRVRQMANFIKELIECHGCRLKCYPHKKTCEQTLVEWLKSEVKND